MNSQETDNLSFKDVSFQKPKASHNWLNFSLVFVNVVTYGVMIFFNIASSIPNLSKFLLTKNFILCLWKKSPFSKDIFPRSNGDVSNANPVDLRPAGWTFSTWGIIYAWTGKD